MLFQATLLKEFTWYLQEKGKIIEKKQVLPEGSVVDVYGFIGQSEVMAHAYCIIYHEQFDGFKAINISHCKPT